MHAAGQLIKEIGHSSSYAPAPLRKALAILKTSIQHMPQTCDALGVIVDDEGIDAAGAPYRRQGRRASRGNDAHLLGRRHRHISGRPQQALSGLPVRCQGLGQSAAAMPSRGLDDRGLRADGTPAAQGGRGRIRRGGEECAAGPVHGRARV